MTAHEVAVMIERALRAHPGFEGFEIEPPDGEAEPTGFGLSFEGELLYVVEVSEW